ncbi:MAG: threonine synthase, partial [Hyphomicrobiales bacterium]|nr:threonine synthase [Hyphomicrobiales bacterium]
VVLATAAPAKFPEAMRALAGAEAPLPARLAYLMSAPERIARVANDAPALMGFIRRNARAAEEAAP